MINYPLRYVKREKIIVSSDRVEKYLNPDTNEFVERRIPGITVFTLFKAPTDRYGFEMDKDGEEVVAILNKHKEVVSILSENFDKDKKVQEEILSVPKVEDSDGLNYFVKNFNFRTRTLNAFKDNGIITVRDLIAKTEEEVLGLNGIGLGSLVEVKNKLSELGLSFKL